VSKGKAPAFQFYVRDWLSDPQLRMCCFAVRGMWMDFLCYMWLAPEKGRLSGTVEGLARLIGATLQEMELFLTESMNYEFANVTCNGNVTNCNSEVTLCNRRMHRDHIDRENTRLRVQRHREKQDGNEEITPPSSSSSSSASTKVLIYTPEFEQFWDFYPKKVGKQGTFNAWKKKRPPIDKVMAALKWQIESKQWQEGFIPNPSTYLNQGRWEDEPEPDPPGQPQSSSPRDWNIDEHEKESQAEIQRDKDEVKKIRESIGDKGNGMICHRMSCVLTIKACLKRQKSMKGNQSWTDLSIKGRHMPEECRDCEQGRQVKVHPERFNDHDVRFIIEQRNAA